MTALSRSRLPRFSGGGAVDYSTSDILQPQQIGSGFVGFTWDLGTDGSREAHIAEAKRGVERNRLEIERELRELEAAIRAHAAGRRGAPLGPRVGHRVASARRRRTCASASSSSTPAAQRDDVLDAQALLAQQRATLATALYQAHTRRAELQQLMGQPLDPAVSQQR